MKSSIEQNRWEVGSEFHWQGIPRGPFLKWPEPYIMLASGRSSMLSILKSYKKQFSDILFVPDYFCQEVTEWWKKQGITIKRYIDGPHLAEPVWETFDVSSGDAVLAVNYFGVRSGNIWKRWQEDNDNVLLIEDHSHDPVSVWALQSRADFAFASLRKTFPVSDGAILWSPKGLQLPNEPLCSDWRGSSFKLAAMILKKEYLDGNDDGIKEIFRSFQVQGEALLGASKLVAVSAWSRALLSFGYPIEWRKKREKNVKLFFKLIEGNHLAEPLFNEWPINHCPFNAVLRFSSKGIREKYRKILVDENIYPAVHWELENANLADNMALSDRIMTIPVDQRYGEKDVKRIVEIMFNKK